MALASMQCAVYRVLLITPVLLDSLRSLKDSRASLKALYISLAMADPISLVTGVAGLIKASCDINKLLTNIIGSMKDAPAQAAVAMTDMNETRTILSQLQKFILRFEKADKLRMALIQVDQLIDVISDCVATFSEFEAMLENIAGRSMTLVGRAKWAVWDEEKISGLVARLQRHKSSLSLLVIILTGYSFWLSPSSWYN
jgi:hypothetical protein